MKKHFHSCVFILLAVLLFASCRSYKETVGVRRDVAPIATKLLIDSIEHETLDFDLLSAKLSIKYKADQSLSLRGTLRMKKDSLIWMSLSPGLGVEAARVLIQKNEVVFMDKLKKNYARYNYQELSEKFNIPLDFFMIQSLITGNHLLELKPDSFYSEIHQKRQYKLSNFSNRELKKIKKNKLTPEELVYLLLVDPTKFRPEEQQLTDAQRQRSLQLSYEDFEAVNNSFLPERIRIKLLAEQKSEIGIKFSKVETPDRLKFNFRIPSKYDEVH